MKQNLMIFQQSLIFLFHFMNYHNNLSPGALQKGVFMNRKMEKLGFIGAGNMATALVKGLITSGIYPSDQLMASDKNEEQLQKMSDQFGLKVYASNKDLVGECRNVVLAVKPQSIREVLEGVKEEIKEVNLMISIAAGTPLKMIQSILELDIPLIRVMPNTPALIQKGVSALAPGQHATTEHMDIARGIFDAVGRTVIVQEEMMDAVTALSGSGPAYLFRVMECLVDAGERLGLGAETSLTLVMQTVIGSAHLANESEKSLSQLREMVTSPGGTTEAALAVFNEKGLESVIQEAVKAACLRGVELGKNY
jgi:pyrroline-5-carboxylate reductase